MSSKISIEQYTDRAAIPYPLEASDDVSSAPGRTEDNTINIRLPAFEALDENEIEHISRLMNRRRFDPSLAAAVGARCRHGRVKVLVCRPFPPGIGDAAPLPQPMPTSFWLVCPHAARVAGTSESNGGVKRLDEWLSAHEGDKWEQYAQLHRNIRLSMMSDSFRTSLEKKHPSMYASLASGGVGGIISSAGEIHVKCIHLQTASWLALGYHPGEEWLRAEGLGSECSICSC